MIIKTSYPFMKPPPSARLIRGHRSAQGLVGAWTMAENGGLQVFDLSGNGKYCTLNGPIWKPDGVYLDGVNDQFYAADSDIWTPTQGLTVIARLTVHTLPPFGTEGIVAHYIGRESDNTSVNQRSWFLGMRASPAIGKLYVGLSSSGAFQSANEILAGDTAASVGVPFTAAFTWDPNDSTRLYYNGVQDGENATKPTSLHNCTYPLYIGAQFREYGHASQADGMINATFWWVYIYNRALSAGEIAELYWKPFGMFERKARTALTSGYEVVAPPTGIPIFRRRRAG